MNSMKYKLTIGVAALNLVLAFAAFGQTQKTEEGNELKPNQTIERELSR